LLRKTGRELVACLDEKQFYTIQSLYNIVVKDKNYTEEYLLALLNSHLFTYIYNKFFITNPEVFPYIKRRHLDQLPIKKISKEEQELFISAVNRIIKLKQKKSNADISSLEYRLNQLVYKVYSLTPEEIALIENGQ
jgi:adenine-specific DNA-methyltransferase